MKIEKLYSNHKCDKCKYKKATHGVLEKPVYRVVCDECLKKLQYQDAINDLFHY